LPVLTAEMAGKISPYSVDVVRFAFCPDPANRVDSTSVHGVISAFLLYPTNKFGPPAINVVISVFWFYMPYELGQTVVDCTTYHFSHLNLSESSPETSEYSQVRMDKMKQPP